MDTERYKSIQLRVPVAVHRLLTDESTDLTESLGQYGVKAICERFARDKISGRFERVSSIAETELYRDAADYAEWRKSREKTGAT